MMREVEEKEAWAKLRASKAAIQPGLIVKDHEYSVSVDDRLTVICGLNGSGKTRLLEAAAKSDDRCVLFLAHEFCEQVRQTLKTRADIVELAEESPYRQLDTDELRMLSRIVGRDYDSVEWFSLELESIDGGSGTTIDSPSFQGWPVDDTSTLLPYFRVGYGGRQYTSLTMGLGELSIHTLVWLLWNYRDAESTVFLLDEPDAYLPPRTRSVLMAWLAKWAQTFGWSFLITSHAEEVLELAHSHEGLVVLVRQGEKIHVLPTSAHTRSVARHLLHERTPSILLVTEDESAAALTRALLRLEPDLLAQTEVVWSSGDGAVRKLHQHLPRVDGLGIRFALVLDGDMRKSKKVSEDSKRLAPQKRWPLLLLPTDESPDALYRTMRSVPETLASALGIPLGELVALLGSLEGSNDHDWVNRLCSHAGQRTRFLDVLADLWVSSNHDAAKTFIADLKTGTAS